MKSKGFRIIGCVFIAIGAIAGFSAAVMLLWNAIIPDIFGLGTISFCQALGLLALVRILFGGFGHGRMHRFAAAHGMHGRNHIREKWMKMTPEERKEFVKRHKEHRCGRGFGHGHFFDDRDFNFDVSDPDKKDNE